MRKNSILTPQTLEVLGVLFAPPPKQPTFEDFLATANSRELALLEKDPHAYDYLNLKGTP